MIDLTIDGGKYAELTKAIAKLKRKFDGDSNDAEHDAAVDLVNVLEAILGGKTPTITEEETVNGSNKRVSLTRKRSYSYDHV
jgi:hypothetical protein